MRDLRVLFFTYVNFSRNDFFMHVKIGVQFVKKIQKSEKTVFLSKIKISI